MAELKTVSGDVLYVDDEDVPRLEGKRLYTLKARKLRYAVFVERKPEGGQRTVLVHRHLLDAPSGTQVDHWDRDGMNCRRGNLRFATHSQNQANRGSMGSTSDFLGVSWDRTNRKWTAHIQVDRRQKNLGRFVDETEAARVYDVAALAAWGEFANLNFPDATPA